VKQNYLEYFKYGPYLFYKRNIMPFYLIFFVTSRCNARCPHCFNWKRAAEDVKDLTIDEYRMISAKMPNLVFMFLSGGEPFLREDFAEIAQIFHKNNKVQKMQTPSNGSCTENMRRQAETILRTCPDLHYSITLSVDALGEAHDRNRNFPGLFERVMESYRVLKELQKKYDNFGLNFEITVSKFNQDTLIETYEFLRQRCDAQNVFTVLTRGRPRDPEASQVDLDRFEELNERVKQDLREGTAKGYFGFPFSSWMNAKNLYSREIVARTARERRYQIPCFAGVISGNIFNNGDVYPCELLDLPFGNLRESGYDLRAVWLSDKAKAIKRYIRESKCFCTHECFLNTNLFFNIRNLPPIMKRWVYLKTNGKVFGSV